MKTCVFLLLLAVISVNSHRNNACKRYRDYLFLDWSKHCYYNPDVDKTSPEIIEAHIGVQQTFTVETEDGYILTLHRLPRNNPKGVVLFLPPLFSDSKVWLAQGNKSTALLFWDEGYDVWLGNTRGTIYSKKHSTLSSSDPKFWDFSFHEMGVYDVTAFTSFIVNTTNSKIIQIGQSLGGTIPFIYASLKPQHALETTKLILTMSPITFLKYVKSPAKYYSYLFRTIQPVNDLVQWKSIFSRKSWYVVFLKLFNNVFPFKKLIVYFVELFCGWTPNEYDPELFNSMVGAWPSAVSFKTLYHYSQIYLSNGQFQLYDYGKRNFKIYGESKPPLYPLDQIKVPVVTFYSRIDTMSTTKDVALLRSKLPKEATIWNDVEVKGVNHIDYFYSKIRVDNVFDKVFAFLDNITVRRYKFPDPT